MSTHTTFEHADRVFNYDHDKFMKGTHMNQVTSGLVPLKHVPFFFFKDKTQKKLEDQRFGEGFVKHMQLLINKIEQRIPIQIRLNEYMYSSDDIALSEYYVYIPQTTGIICKSYSELDSGERKLLKSLIKMIKEEYCIDLGIYKNIKKQLKDLKPTTVVEEETFRNLEVMTEKEFTSDDITTTPVEEMDTNTTAVVSTVTPEVVEIPTTRITPERKQVFEDDFMTLNVELMEKFFNQLNLEIYGSSRKEHKVQALMAHRTEPDLCERILVDLKEERMAAAAAKSKAKTQPQLHIQSEQSSTEESISQIETTDASADSDAASVDSDGTPVIVDTPDA